MRSEMVTPTCPWGRHSRPSHGPGWEADAASARVNFLMGLGTSLGPGWEADAAASGARLNFHMGLGTRLGPSSEAAVAAGPIVQ